MLRDSPAVCSWSDERRRELPAAPALVDIALTALVNLAAVVGDFFDTLP